MDLVGLTSRSRLDYPETGPIGPITIPADTRYATLSTGGLSAAWEVDLFGARQRPRCCSSSRARHAEKQHGAQMLVAADIASNSRKPSKPAAWNAASKFSTTASPWPNACSSTRKAAFDAGHATRFDVDRARTQG